MKILPMTVCFSTPAFLGNAAQSAQWRIPPFKAQLRQWWRVAYAANQGFKPDAATMRHEEGCLFGHAWLESDADKVGNKLAARKSEVRLRLDRWSHGRMDRANWQPLDRVDHPEVNARPSADLYMGYGPVILPRGAKQSTLKANAAIQADESAKLSIAFPDAHAPLIEHAVALMDRFGSVGGRSRNGWGSYSLRSEIAPQATHPLPLRDWRNCLDLDWPHAIGRDQHGALIWQTTPFANWKLLMRELAVIKIGLRTQFRFPNLRPDGQVYPRHWLSYPVGKDHVVTAWGKNARLPNSLRFKVVRTPNNELVGKIFHMPCSPPPAFSPEREAIEQVWSQVHAFLDNSNQLTRVDD